MPRSTSRMLDLCIELVHCNRENVLLLAVVTFVAAGQREVQRDAEQFFGLQGQAVMPMIIMIVIMMTAPVPARMVIH